MEILVTDVRLSDRLPDDLPTNPMHRAHDWMNEAADLAGMRNPNSMTLTTVGAGARPSARIVLCKSIVADPGYLVFFTNYGSRKGEELKTNSAVAAVFHWDSIGRQIRIEGTAVKSPAADSDAYFTTRSWGSQLGAWGSDQSREIASREALVAQVRERARALGIQLGHDTQTLENDTPPVIERPPHWGGYRIWASAIELWVEGADRIHDRARWTRQLSPIDAHTFEAGPWHGTRLQP